MFRNILLQIKKPLDLYLMRFRWTRNGYVFEKDSQAEKAYQEFKSNYQNLDLETKKILEYFFDDVSLVVVSLKEKHETHYIGADKAQNKSFEDFNKFLILNVNILDLPENLRYSISQTRRG